MSKKKDALPEGDNKLDIKLLEKKYIFMRLIYDQEMERKKTIENKASLFLTSNAIIGSLLAASSRFLFEAKSNQTLIGAIVLLLLTGFLTLTIIFTLKVLKKDTFEKLDENDANDYDSETSFYVGLIEKTRTAIIINKEVINRKVDYMSKALSYYKHFWITLLLVFILYFIYNIYDFPFRDIFFEKCFHIISM